MFLTKEIRIQIEQVIGTMEQRIKILEDLDHREEGWAADPVLQNAAERALHIAVECVTDVGNLLIDNLVMRDAGGYEDIVRVLLEEHVITWEWYQSFLGAIEFRRRLIREYQKVDGADVELATAAYYNLFLPYADFVRKYVEIETQHTD